MPDMMYLEPEGSQDRTEREQLAEAAEAAKEINQKLANISEQVFHHLISQVSSASEKIVNQVRRRIFGEADKGALEALRSLRIPTADIEHNCDQLRSQVEADRYSGTLLCQRIGESSFVPISDTEVAGNEEHYRKRLGQDVNFLPTEEAVNNFCNELNRFLTQRVAGQGGYIPPAKSVIGLPPGMLPVRVFSPTFGARVSYSPAYFINYITLSAPTSPVTGAILPGRYIFMLSINFSRKFDQGVFDIPPSLDINLLV